MAMKPRAMKKKTPMRGGGMGKKTMMRSGGAAKKKMMRGGTPTKAGPKGYTKKAGSKTARPQSQTSMIKDKLDAMSAEERKKIIMQMLQGKTPKAMQPFVKK